jgi:tyrosine-protein kinase Etk/Wzc
MAQDAQGGIADRPNAGSIGSAVDGESEIDIVAAVQKLSRGRMTIIRTSLGGLLLVTVIASILRPQYISVVSFIPPNLNNSNSMASAFAGQLSVMGAGDLLGSVKNSGDLYAGILRSRSVVSELVRRFNLMQVYRVKREGQAENILGQNTAIVVDIKSSIVEVKVTASSPSLARDLANGYMDVLSETNGRLALGQSSQRRLFFGQQLAKEKDDLENAEVQLKQTQEQSGLIAPSGQTESEIKTIADTQAQIASREVALAALRESATEQHPEVVRLRSEITDLENQLSRLQRGSGQDSTLAIPTSKVPGLELDYVRREREVKYHEALFDMLSRQYEAARLDEARDAPLVQVLDTASYPDTKSWPKRTYFAAGGLLVGFVLGLLWVLLHDAILECWALISMPRPLSDPVNSSEVN